jgi:serine/threonine protein kinase
MCPPASGPILPHFASTFRHSMASGIPQADKQMPRSANHPVAQVAHRYHWLTEPDMHGHARLAVGVVMDELDPSHAMTCHDLAECLGRLHIRADTPSLRALEIQTGRNAGRPLPGTRLKSVRLGRTSLNDVLHGRKFPKKSFMLTFVAACGVDLEADRRWEETWDRLADEHLRQPDEAESRHGSHVDAGGSRAERADVVIEELRSELVAMRLRAERAEIENEQLRMQIAGILAEAEQGGVDKEQVRQLIALRVRPKSSVPPDPTIEPLRPWDPESIGSYVLLGRLGAGAMGRVYLARSVAGLYVAVKLLRIELAEEPDFRVRFTNEVAAARTVSGPFTAPIIAADTEADLPWLATAYVPAPSLSQLVEACGPLPTAAVRWLAIGCAEALESIHSAGLIHRDLKPSNVLVTLDGPRVIDFGLAQAVDRLQLTMTGIAVSTPAYMAPEQARDPQAATTASDIFALGATLLFAATGHGPYQGDVVIDVLVRLATEAPDLAGLPSELDDLIRACLQRDPLLRPKPGDILYLLGRDVKNSVNLSSEKIELSASAVALIERYRSISQLKAIAREALDRSDEAPDPLPMHLSSINQSGSRSLGSLLSAILKRPALK